MSRTLGNTIGAQKGLREGCAEIVHTYPFAYNTSGVDAGIKVDTISASTDSPVELEFSLQVIVDFDNGVSADINIGTVPSGEQWLASTDIDATSASYYPVDNAVKKYRITTNSDVYITYAAGGTDTQGSAVLMVKEFTQNIIPIV